MRRKGRRGSVFNKALTWWGRGLRPACCLFSLVAVRLPCCLRVTSSGVRVMISVHADQQLWFMHLSRCRWNIKFNFAAVDRPPPLQSSRFRLGWTDPPPPPPACSNSLLPLQYARRQHLNETFVGVGSEQRLLSQFGAGEQGRGVGAGSDCNGAVSRAGLAHENEACWMWAAEQSVCRDRPSLLRNDGQEVLEAAKPTEAFPPKTSGFIYV